MISKIIEKSYKFIAYISIIIMLVIIIFNNFLNNETIVNNIEQLFFIGVFITVCVVLNNLILHKASEKTSKIIILVLLATFLILEIISVIYFKVERNWDFKWVMDTAEDLAKTGGTDKLHYFQVFPNNIGALTIVTLSMWITNGAEIGAYIANIIFVFLSAIFAMLASKKIGGYKLAINTLLIMLLCCPIYLYTPIVYTDTLSIFIPVATLYFWLLAKETNNKRKKYIYWGILSILSVIGYSLKPVAMIVYIAIIIETIIYNRKYIKQLAVSLILFIILLVSYNTAEEKIIIKNSPWTYPFTHWIMMGLNKPESEGGTSIGWGAYSAEDNEYTGVQPSVELKKEANIKRIKERLSEFGFIGYIEFLFNKFEYVWNDGTYYVFNKIGWDTINKDTTLYECIIGEKSNYIIKPFLSNLHQFMMMMIMIAIIIDIKIKEHESIRIMGISMVGIAIFLLFWEARSRYIYFLIPIFCILSAYGIYKISSKSLKKLEDKYEGEKENEK